MDKKTIAQRHVPGDAYVSPHYGDGGWHGSSIGSVKFDTDWEPLFDRILVKRIAEQPKGLIIAPETAAKQTDTSRGIVLRVGRGKRIEGEGDTRRPLEVAPGDEIIFGRFTDWDSFGEDVVLIQEADIRVVTKWVTRISAHGWSRVNEDPTIVELDGETLIIGEKREPNADTKLRSKKKAAG